MNDVSTAPHLVPGRNVRPSRPYLIFVLVGAIVIAPVGLGVGGCLVVAMCGSIIRDPGQFFAVFWESPRMAVGGVVLFLAFVVFGLCSLAIGVWQACSVVAIGRTLLRDERLVIGADRFQVVAGPERVVSELHFTDVAEVKLVELESDSWREHLVGLCLHGEKGLERQLGEGVCTIPRLRRWYNRRTFGCDLTLGGDWPRQAQLCKYVLSRYNAFRGISTPPRKGKLTRTRDK